MNISILGGSICWQQHRIRVPLCGGNLESPALPGISVDIKKYLIAYVHLTCALTLETEVAIVISFSFLLMRKCIN